MPKISAPDRAHAALRCDAVDAKLAAVAALAADAARGVLDWTRPCSQPPPQTPGRPARPVLVDPRALARRSTATRAGHAALIHAVAHIELNAIDLALDALCRFPGLPQPYYQDWLRVAQEEANHFRLLRDHLRTLDHDYGDFPAHDGLWEMAVKTAHDPLARMALVPRVLEARGLDASPGIIRRLEAAGDRRGAEIIALILREEVEHVAIGSRWFAQLCEARGLEPQATFARLLQAFDAPRAVLPLNVEARARAQFSAAEIAHLEALARGRRGA